MADGSYFKGFGVTFRKLFEDRVTGDYRGGKAKEGAPDEKRAKPERFHDLLYRFRSQSAVAHGPRSPAHQFALTRALIGVCSFLYFVR